MEPGDTQPSGSRDMDNKAYLERRGHKRHDLGCPVRVLGRAEDVQSKGKTINISDGGMLVEIPAGDAPDVGQDAHACVAIPRTTPNTHMLEDFELDATVVRRSAAQDGNSQTLALRFGSKANLSLEG